jgi:hypothetical protein
VAGAWAETPLRTFQSLRLKLCLASAQTVSGNWQTNKRGENNIGARPTSVLKEVSLIVVQILVASCHQSEDRQDSRPAGQAMSSTPDASDPGLHLLGRSVLTMTHIACGCCCGRIFDSAAAESQSLGLENRSTLPTPSPRY